MHSEIILQVIILFILLYLAFFKSYLSEKGKSAALKEDLADLTREVEQVKSDFSRDHEILRIDLQRALSNEISYQNEVRNALISYHAVISQWLYTILSISVSDYDSNKIDALISLRQSLDSFYAKAGIANSKVQLLVNNDDLCSAAQDLYLASFEFYQWSTLKLHTIQRQCQRQRNIAQDFLAIQKDSLNRMEVGAELAIEDRHLQSSRIALIEQFNDERKSEYAKVLTKENFFKTKLKEYLKE